MNYSRFIAFFAIVFFLQFSNLATAQTTVTIGSGTSSSSTRGPFQRADTASSTVYSRWVQVFTASELSAAGVTSGVSISELQWDLASSNTIIGSGNANLKIYVKNSSATLATSDTWVNHIAGSTLVVDNDYNTTNNFPGAQGWMPFTFTSPFVYTGGALEVAVDWDCSQVSTPAFSGNGALKFRWSSLVSDLVVKKTGSSTAPSTISDLKSERANIQIVYSMIAACPDATNLNASNISMNSADFNWTAAAGASSYNWKVVNAGAGAMAAAADSGSVSGTSASSVALSALTSYDLYVQTDCGATGLATYAGPFTFLTSPVASAMTTIGVGTSSSSTRGPFQRSDTASSTVFSRFVHVYTAAELSAAGFVNGDIITSLNWDLASDNQIIGAGDANLKIYVKNSTATAAAADTWVNLTAGSTLVFDQNFNTTNNFPGAQGWMAFNFSSPLVYTGDAIEIAVDWDCSQVSTPAFSGDGSLKWRYSSTAPDDLVVKKTSSSSPSSTISDLKDERANIQFVYAINSCDSTTGLGASNISTNQASLFWSPSVASNSYNWLVVAAGDGPSGTAVASGMVADTSVIVSGLMAGTSYEFYVMSDCGGIGTSSYAGPYSFQTLCANVPATSITSMVTPVSCNGGNDGSIDLTVTSGISPFTFAWANTETTEDVDDLTAGMYLVTITDANGCPYTDSVEVTEPEMLSASIAETNVSCATGNDGELDLSVNGGTMPYTFTWSNAANTEDLIGVVADTYSVDVLDANNCTVSANAVLTEPEALVLVGSSVADVDGAGVGSASVSVSGGTMPYSYEWDGTAGTETLTDLIEGNYTVIVVDSNNCSAELGVQVENVVAIADIENLEFLNISPNPSNGIVRIDMDLTNTAQVAISVYSSTGELIENIFESNTNEIAHTFDFTNFSEGLYVVRISIDENLVTKKMLILK